MATPDLACPSAADQNRGPAARRIVLGARLRRLREAANISRAEAGYSIRGSESKIRRLESGKVGFKERDVADLLTLYGVLDDRDREVVLELVRSTNEPGWWRRFSDVIPEWFEDYVGLEVSAAWIQTYELLFIPGLLQTEDYTRAVVTSGHPEVSDPEIERRIGVRKRRQGLLSRPDAPRYWAVLDEAVLHRPIGGTSVLTRQLDQLIELAELPNVTLQVLPFAMSGFAAEGSFALLRFAEPELPDLVYLEHHGGALYLDDGIEVEAYTRLMDRLTIDALTPEETRQLLARLRAER